MDGLALAAAQAAFESMFWAGVLLGSVAVAFAAWGLGHIVYLAEERLYREGQRRLDATQ